MAKKNPPKAEAKEKAAPAGADDLGTAAGVKAGLLAWLIPGGGHFLLGRRRRGLTFLAIVLLAACIGCALEGNLSTRLAGSPLEILRTLACLGLGVVYFVLRLAGYAGEIQAAGYEYGGAFIVTSGLMNLLLVLDAWDIARGRKS